MKLFIGTKLTNDPSYKCQFKLPKNDPNDNYFSPQAFLSTRSMKVSLKGRTSEHREESQLDNDSIGSNSSIGIKILKSMGKRHFENVAREDLNELIVKLKKENLQPVQTNESESEDFKLKEKLNRMEEKNKDCDQEFILCSEEPIVILSTEVVVPSDFKVETSTQKVTTGSFCDGTLSGKFIPSGSLKETTEGERERVSVDYPIRTVTNWIVKDRLLFKRFGLEEGPVSTDESITLVSIQLKPSIEEMRSIFGVASEKKFPNIQPVDTDQDSFAPSIKPQSNKRMKAADLF